MEFKLQTLRFNATEKLVAFIDKKIAKLEKYGEVQNVELTLQVVKPETANNKEANFMWCFPVAAYTPKKWQTLLKKP